MIGAYILNATKNKYEYNHIASEFLDISYPDVEELLGRLKSKKPLFEIEEEEWLKYCVRQSRVSYLVKNIMEKEIKENNQEELFYNIEMPLVYVLASMEIIGIKASEKELIEYKENLEKEIDSLTKEIYWLAGEEFNINSPKQLGLILFDKMGLKGGKKTATSWSTSADILEKITGQSEIIQKILDYRTYAKLKSTYADGLLNVLNKETGRIHSNFKQTVTATGRLSSTEPNLQNIPIKLELGHRIRKVFKPEDDFLFVDADYSQIELRVLAHLSGDEILIKSFNEGEDIHKLTASQIFGKNIDEITSFERSAAKAINFGLIYGKQAFSLSQELGISKKDAEKYIDGYFEKYPKIKGFLDNVIKETRENGYAKTIFNRKRYIPEINSTNFMQKNAAERVAMNTPIQGTAADIIKIAMVKVYERIKKENLKSRLILQVHDELLIEAHKSEIEKIKTILLEEMENAIEFSVKLLIDIHTGENWYEAK
ncbi:MAG: DNA polymerase I, partial [Eubacteriales bacterium]|nr:DNA polymerase I [Eubacteriales bacterium]